MIKMKARYVAVVAVAVSGCATTSGMPDSQRAPVAAQVKNTEEAAQQLQNIIAQAEKLGSQLRAGGAADKSSLACSCGGGVRPLYIGPRSPAPKDQDPLEKMIDVLQVVAAARNADKTTITIGPE
jgi:hypothetical protein